MSVKGPLMYKVQPLYDFSPDISLPDCMYNMNNIYGENASTQSTKEGGVDLADVEKRQQIILHSLEDLKNTVIRMKDELGIKDKVVEIGNFHDIVIKANPDNPPLSLWVLYELLHKSVPMRIVTYKHSSLGQISEGAKMLEELSSSDHCNLSLTVIWREGEKDLEMVVDPINQGVIEGEANIVRYISRLLSPDYETDPFVSTKIDNWLEIAHSSIIHGNSKDRQGALRSLNGHLGKCMYLVGDNLTVADIVTWSTIVQAKLHTTLPTNVSKWFKNLLNLDVFKRCNGFVSL